MSRHLLRTVKCRGDGNCGYHSLLNGICHPRGQVCTNAAVSAAIFCQRCSSFQIRWRYQPRWCLPLQHTSFTFGIFSSTRACPFVLPLHRRLYMYLCTTPNTTWTLAYRCVGLCVRVHVLCVCTSPQEHLSCIVYSVFRRQLPCNPSTAHVFISHRRLRNTTLFSACTGHQIRASQCTHSLP